jgi:hypothetical protein
MFRERKLKCPIKYQGVPKSSSSGQPHPNVACMEQKQDAATGGQEKLPTALTYADMKALGQAAIESAVSRHFSGKTYDRNLMMSWVDEANSHICSALAEVSQVRLVSIPCQRTTSCSASLQNFKYCINTVVVQKSGSGFESSASTFWDTTTDGVLSVQWASSHLVVVTTVFVTAL